MTFIKKHNYPSFFEINIEEQVDYFIQNNFDINKPVLYGLTLLSIATTHNSHSAVKKLLLYGANPNFIPKNGYSPLMEASREGFVETSELLLNFNANPNLQDAYGLNSLMFACLNNNLDIVRLLINKEADINLTTNEGHTVFYYIHSSEIFFELEHYVDNFSKIVLEDYEEKRLKLLL